MNLPNFSLVFLYLFILIRGDPICTKVFIEIDELHCDKILFLCFSVNDLLLYFIYVGLIYG